MPASKPLLSYDALEPLIFSIRGRRIMLDADLARLYGVTTKQFNEAFKRNRRRFPEPPPGAFHDLNGDRETSAKYLFCVEKSNA